MTGYQHNEAFSAFTADSLGGLHDGATFVLPPSDSAVTLIVNDDDLALSAAQQNGQAVDITGQTATLEGPAGRAGTGGRLFAEAIYWVVDRNGVWYALLELRHEESETSYFSFYAGPGFALPPEDAELTVQSRTELSGDQAILYPALGVGDVSPAPDQGGSVSGQVHIDGDGDGTAWNADTLSWEAGIAGVQVDLTDSTGAVVASTTTDATGSYSFDTVEPGTYRLVFHTTEEAAFAPTPQTSTGATLADAGPNTTAAFTISAETPVATIDAAVQPTLGAISGTVWSDLNRDGLQDLTRTIRSEVVVADETFEGGATGWSDNQTDQTVDSEFLGYHGYKHGVDTQKTFDIPTGAERVTLTFDLLEIDGWENEAFNILINGQSIELGRFSWGAEEDASSFGAGYGITVHKDAPRMVDHVGAITKYFFLYDSTHAFTITIDNPGEQLTIGFDSELDSSSQDESWGVDNLKLVADVARTEVQEPVVAGVEISLRDASGTVVATTVTDAEGQYAFAALPVGDYSLYAVAPDGTEFTLQDAGPDDSLDSDVTTGGLSGTLSVTAGGVLDVDLGTRVQTEGTLSGRVFLDENRDGIDTDEAGFAGVLVTLLDGAGASTGVTTTTSSDGSYSFAALAPGSYGVAFSDPGGVLAGTSLVAPNLGGDDSIDSDAIGDTGLSVISGITVVAGADTSDNDAGVTLDIPPPDPLDDAATTQADEILTVDVLANDTTPTGAGLTITAVDGQAIDEGGSITTAAGTLVTLLNGQLQIDGEAAHAALDIGEFATETFSYTVTDGIGSASANLAVTFCGDANSVESLDSALKAAGAEVTFQILPVDVPGFVDGYTMDLIAATPAGLVPLGIHTEAYCMDGDQPIEQGVITKGKISLLTEANAAAVSSAINTANADAVNWLLNQNFTAQDNGDGTGDTYTKFEVQEAVWTLMNGDVFIINNFANPEFQDDGNGVRDGAELATLANVQEIAQAALANGEGFVPQDGDLVGLLIDPFDPVSQEQPFVVGVSFDAIDSLC